VRYLLLLAAAFLQVSCGRGGNTSSQSTPQKASSVSTADNKAPAQADTEVDVEMANVNIYLDPSLVMQVRHLTGKFHPTKKGQPPSFDDKLSYILAIDSAEIAVSLASMTHALNTYVFGDKDAPIKDVQLSVEKNRLKQKGTMKKGIGIPFEMVGDLAVTPDGKLRIHPTEMKAAHLPVKGLMKLFGVEMAELINTRHTRGIRVDENDLILDPSLMLPPPQMRGRITIVRIQGDDIVQTFGDARPRPAVKGPSSNYMAYRGGVLRFGKLTMNPADMRLVDNDPKDPFEFFPDRYSDHLVAGYSKTTPSGGLNVFMPDYDQIPNQSAARSAP
jgi:hypothetical protein